MYVSWVLVGGGVISGVGGGARMCGDVAQECAVVLVGSFVMTWLEGMR